MGLVRLARQGVAYATHGPDHGALLIAELVAQGADVDLDQVAVAEVVGAPDPIEQHVAGEYLPGMKHELFEQLELARGERDWPAVLEHLAGAAVEEHLAEAESLLDEGGPPAQDGSDTRQQLLEPERLGQVVVGAGFEPFD